MGLDGLAHVYQSEDLPELRRILSPGSYHAVVANPPYINVPDPVVSKAYRERYSACHRSYTLAVPFMVRIFDLAIKAVDACSTAAGFTGQITSNNFMTAAFGRKIIEEELAELDITHLVDTSIVYLPGHGTPTIIVFGRNRRPTATTIRAVMGIKGESRPPSNPAMSPPWRAIVELIDRPGSQNDFLTVADLDRELFKTHPWSLSGGGAIDLKLAIESRCDVKLSDVIEDMGRSSHTGEDQLYCFPWSATRRFNMARDVVPFLEGKGIRDYQAQVYEAVLFPYNCETAEPKDFEDEGTRKHAWRYRRSLKNRRDFGQTVEQRGLRWIDHTMFFPRRYRAVRSLILAFVTTHNHFSWLSIRGVSNKTAPQIILRNEEGNAEAMALLGYLNTSTAWFWLKQVCFTRGGDPVGKDGARIRKTLWDLNSNINNSSLKPLPIPKGLEHERPTELVELAKQLATTSPRSLVMSSCWSRTALDAAAQEHATLLRRMIGIQEDQDWCVYGLLGLVDDAVVFKGDPPETMLGQRAFEIVMARRPDRGELDTSWFERHGSTPVTQVPGHWSKEYRELVERRIELIENNQFIGLVEHPEYKRRWASEPWNSTLKRELRYWLLDRVEGYFDLDGRMDDSKHVTAASSLCEPRLTCVAEVADLARKDTRFMQVAELFVGRMDFDVTNLVTDLIAAECFPALPRMRYRQTGLDKREAWERTWNLQRLEDVVDDLFKIDRLEQFVGAAELGGNLMTMDTSTLPIAESSARAVARELETAMGFVAEATEQGLNLQADTVTKPILDAAKRAKTVAVGDITLPPQYKSSDFLHSNFWRLRGKLDVAKERWVSYPHCEGEDGTLVIAWAGYDHLQLARAIAGRYELAKEQEGRKLVPLLAAIGQLIPWLKQWHNDLDPAFGTRMGDYYENYLAEEAKAIGKSVEEVMAWTPPAKVKKTRKRRTKTAAKP